MVRMVFVHHPIPGELNSFCVERSPVMELDAPPELERVRFPIRRDGPARRQGRSNICGRSGYVDEFVVKCDVKVLEVGKRVAGIETVDIGSHAKDNRSSSPGRPSARCRRKPGMTGSQRGGKR